MSDLLDIPPPPSASPFSLVLHAAAAAAAGLSGFDLAVVGLVACHLLFTALSAAFILHFHLRSVVGLTPLRRRLRLLLRLNSLWPVRLLLLLLSSLVSLSELLRLPRHRPLLCNAYALSSQAFAEPAFFATLLFLLRLSDRKPSPALSFVSAFTTALSVASPFFIVHSLFIFVWPWAANKLALPIDLLATTTDTGRCTHPLYGTVLLALFGAVYVPLFISASWTAVNVVINKRLRVRLYALTAVVVVALSTQVASLTVAALWSPDGKVAQGLGVVAFAAVVVCVAVGEGILVVQPVVDALAIVGPEDGKDHDHDKDRHSLESCLGEV